MPTEFFTVDSTWFWHLRSLFRVCFFCGCMRFFFKQRQKTLTRISLGKIKYWEWHGMVESLRVTFWWIFWLGSCDWLQMQHVLVPSDMDSSLSVTRMMQNRTTLEKLIDEKSVLSVLSALVLVAARIKTLCGSVISGHDRRHSRVPQHV